MTRWLLIALAAAGFFLSPPVWALNVDRLTPDEGSTLHQLLERLNPIIEERRQEGTAALLEWKDLYAPLSSKQRAFLNAMRELRGANLGATAHFFGTVPENTEIIPVGEQGVVIDGQYQPLDLQYLPPPILEAYHRMMKAMEGDLGKSLLVESGYRSGAYQLYLFIFYLPTHESSITETNRFVALPGHSEHGYPPQQAIDFINEEGINGEEVPEEFEALPEYAWLNQHAHRFGFALSYPRDNPHNTAFEPWHWHYEETLVR